MMFSYCFLLLCLTTSVFCFDLNITKYHFSPLAKYLPGRKLIQELPSKEPVSQFVSAALQALEQSDVLYKMIEAAIEDAKKPDVLYELMAKAAKYFNSPLPDAFAGPIVAATEIMLHQLTAESVSNVLAISTARLLNDLGLLNKSNAAELGRKHSNYIEKEPLLVEGANPVIGTYTDVKVVNGMLRFLDTFDILSPLTGLILSNYIISELYNLNNYAESK